MAIDDGFKYWSVDKKGRIMAAIACDGDTSMGEAYAALARLHAENLAKPAVQKSLKRIPRRDECPFSGELKS